MNDHFKKEIVNFVIDKIREYRVSQEELDEAIDVVKKAYYSDATIK